MLSLKEKINENNLDDYQNSNLPSKRNNVDNNQNEISDSNIKLNFINEKSKNSSDSIEENENSNNNLSNNDLPVLSFDKEDSISNLNEDENEEEKEKKLELLYHKYINSYNKKKYENIINDIGNKKFLFNKNSIMSFNIFLLKIKCLLKGLKKEYIKLIILKTEKNNNFLEISKKISKILKEFKSISTIINCSHKNSYEKITQVFSKYLLYLSLISKLKEEYIRSFEYMMLGINSLKIYFIKQGTASEIKTYSIYCKLLILIINQLIGDNNFINALFYCNTAIKVIEVAFKFMKYKNINQKYQARFLEYIGYIYLYIGLCLEQKEIINYKLCFETYKESNYFFKKVEIINNKNLFKHILGENNENIYLILSELLLEKLRKVFEEKKRQEFIYKRKTKDKDNTINQKEKNINLNLINNGYYKNYIKFMPMENNIYKNILSSNIINKIEKMDNELISLIYKHNKNHIGFKRGLSHSIKKNLCQLNIYNFLMSSKFRDFVIKNQNLEFNNPKKEKQSIENLQRYLNTKIGLNIGSTSPSPLRNNSNSNTNKNSKKNETLTKNIDKILLKKKIYKNNRNNNKKSILLKKGNITINKNSKGNKTSYISFSSFASKKREFNTKNKINENTKENKEYYIKSHKSQIENIKSSKKEITNKITLKIPKNMHKNKSTYYINNYSEKKLFYSKSKLGIKNPIFKNSNTLLQNDFERKYIDKNLLSKKYFKKFFYLDSLTTKELSFQKKMLDLKQSNSKLYFCDFKKELTSDEKIAREEAYKKYFELNDKAQQDAKKIQNNDFLKEKKDINLFENSNNVLKVLNKYILTSKEKRIKKIKIYSESYKDIKRTNEDKLLNLNNGIKELNFIISFKNRKLRKNKSLKYYD